MVGGDVVLNTGLADIEVDFVWGTSDITEVGIGNFSGAVDDAAHDGYGNAFEVVCLGSDELSYALEVEEGTSTTWTGDKFSFCDTGTGSLKNIVGEGDGLL